MTGGGAELSPLPRQTLSGNAAARDVGTSPDPLARRAPHHAAPQPGRRGLRDERSKFWWWVGCQPIFLVLGGFRFERRW